MIIYKNDKKSVMKILAISPTGKDVKRIRKKFSKDRVYYIVKCFDEWEKLNGDIKSNETIYKYYDFLPFHYEKKIKNIAYPLAENLLKNEEFAKGLPNYVNELLKMASLHLINKAFRLQLRDYLTCVSIKTRFSDADFVFCSDTNEIIKSFFSEASICYWEKKLSIYLCLKRLKHRLLPFFFAAYKLLFLPVFARIKVRSRMKEARKANDAIFIGYLNEFNHLNEFPISGFSFSKKSLIISPSRKFNSYTNFKNNYNEASVKVIDQYLKTKDIVAICHRYFGNISNIIELLDNYIYKQKNELLDLSRNNIVEFLMYFFLVALKYETAIKNILASHDCEKFFLSYGNTWYMNVVNHRIQECGYKTYSYNHGLIQEALLMTSEVHRMYSTSKYDLHVMEQFSKDLSYECQIRKKNENFKKISLDFTQKINIVILSKFMFVDAEYGQTIDFLKATLTGLQQIFFEHDIIIKPHPKEPIPKLKAFIKEFNNIHVNLDLRELKEILSTNCIVISPMSTTIIECFKYGCPFIIFETKLYSHDTFYKEIPDIIKYKSSHGLNPFFANLYQDFNSFKSIYESLFEKYFYFKEIAEKKNEE